MESMIFELNQAVKMESVYSNLLKAGYTAYEGLSLQITGKKNVEVHLGDILLATGKISDTNRINGSIDWEILNTDPRIVDVFHNKVSKMGVELVREYGLPGDRLYY